MSESYGAFRSQGRIAYLKGPIKPENLIKHLSQELPNTNLESLEFLINLGAVYVNKNRILDAAFILHSQDQVRVHLEPKRYPFNIKELQKNIIFQTQDFVIFNKPSGLPMHATLDNAKENLSAAFETKLYVTNRLDVPTSGLVLLAKNKNYQAHYNQLLSDRKVKKIYQALTTTKPETGLIRHFMVESLRSPKTVITEQEFEGRGKNVDPIIKYDECLLEILSVKSFEFNVGKKIPTMAPGFLSEINLITGRTHQIRAQLSKLGSPIVGDEMYGGIEAPIFGLHCSQLSFESYNWKLDRFN
ncbi:MAG: RluA family pseudouridine synthase [Oligoflexia bacterium]|nr:RluA family pseudouridine synthase [Oligoflexia bacterium]